MNKEETKEKIRVKWNYPDVYSLHWDDARNDINRLLTSLDKAEAQIQELEGAIEKWRDLRKSWNIKFWIEDEELYSHIKEK